MNRLPTLVVPLAFALPVLFAPLPLLAQEDTELWPDGGIPVTSEDVRSSCRRCHRVSDDGRMTRISYSRKTPEGWELTIRRMVSLNGVDLEPDVARRIVRYLSDHHGLAPEEVRPLRFELERRMVDFEFPNQETAATCNACHSAARALIQRRTAEEWKLLMTTHRGLYPLVDFQAFLSNDNEPPHPMDEAAEDLAERYPLETPEWSAWSATMRPPRLSGRWALKGTEVGLGDFYGTVTVTETGDASFSTETVYRYARGSREVRRAGNALVYTGFEWRGRNSGNGDDIREVMMVERDWREMSGRWFAGAYDELGKDVTLIRADGGPVVLGTYPTSMRTGAGGDLTVFGVDLPDPVAPTDVDLGPGITVSSAERGQDGMLRLRVSVSEDARVGPRDLFLGGVHVPGALTVFDEVHRITVTPEWGMARVGGENFPKQHQHFGALAWHDGPDGEAGTGDDLALGPVDATWSLEEYAATLGDDDVGYVGELREDGLFIPAVDGPNPERRGSRNNVGDVWVVASWTPPGAEQPLRARAHLLVTVPLYMRWDPWAPVSPSALGVDGPESGERP